MTFRKAIFFSCAVHLFLFGTSLVFARYSGGLLNGPWEPIMVTLVGRGGNEASAKPDGNHRQHGLQPRLAQKTSLSFPEQTENRFPIPETAPAVTGEAAERLSGGADQETDTSTGHSAEDRAGGGEFGLVSPEQWAVIVSLIERVKNYPRFARERGIEGVVRVRFKLRPQGEVERVEIVKSSGSGVLDESSVRTVYRAAPMPYVNGWVEIPIAYMIQ
jgi:TonB family protein